MGSFNEYAETIKLNYTINTLRINSVLRCLCYTSKQKKILKPKSATVTFMGFCFENALLQFKVYFFPFVFLKTKHSFFDAVCF